MSTLSEYGSESAFEKLQEDAARISCRVRRDGQVVSLPIAEIVVDDVVLLQSGERVPADGILLDGRLAVDQSALNGESHEAVKAPCPMPPTPPIWLLPTVCSAAAWCAAVRE